MKKIASILLIFIYSLSTFGVSLSEFYCCGNLKSVSVTIADDVKDNCGKRDSNDKCCKTKFQYLKVKDSHLVTTDVATPQKFFTDLHTLTPSLQLVTFTTQEVDLINGSHAPPLHTGVPIYISNCVFRI